MVERVSGQDFLSSSEVLDLHRNSDKDKRSDAQHHTLGRTRYQASPGDHNHNGGSSALLLPNQTTIIPSKPDGSSDTANPVVPSFTFSQNLETEQGQKDALKQIIAILAGFGAVDKTQANNGISPFLTHNTYPLEIRTGLTTCTWTTAGLTSPSTPIIFSPAFSAIPRLVCTPLSTSTSSYSVKISAAVTTAGAAVMVMATASVGIGGAVDVHWIAINMGTYT